MLLRTVAGSLGVHLKERLREERRLSAATCPSESGTTAVQGGEVVFWSPLIHFPLEIDVSVCAHRVRMMFV